MFNMYDIENKKPKNSEEECISPELDSVVPLAMESNNVKTKPEEIQKNTVLDEITDICKMRCEYNYELITFFNSEKITLAEKQERFSSMYSMKIDINPKPSSQEITRYIENLRSDLKLYFKALTSICRHKNKQYKDYFPIFFELSEFFKIELTGIKLHTNNLNSKTKSLFRYSQELNEESIFRRCMKKLKPYMESEMQTWFNSQVTIITDNNDGVGYKYTSNFKDFRWLLEQYKPVAHLSKTASIHKLISLIKCDLEQRSKELELLRNKKCQEKDTYTEITIFYRKYFYKLYALEDKIQKNIDALIFEMKNPTAQEEMETKTQFENIKTEDPVEFEINYTSHEAIEQDAFEAYAEFRELRAKKLGQKSSQQPTDEETKESAELTDEQAIIEQLNTYNLKKEHLSTLAQIFKTPVPHYEIKWKSLENLIKKCGGSIDDNTGASRRIIRLPDFKVNNLIDKPINQRGVHQSHQSGHNNDTVSRWSINVFRTALERAGITPEIVGQLSTRATAMHTSDAPRLH